MHVIGVLNEKGGVGKTTLAITLSAGLARRGYKVATIDCDPQGHAAKYLGLEQEPGFFNLLVNEAPIGRLLRRVPEDRWLNPGEDPGGGMLTLLPGDHRTTTAGHALTAEHAPVDVLRRALQPLSGADFLILDTSPTISLLLAMIYYAVDYVLIPTQAESLSMNGLHRANERIRATAQRKPVELLGIVPTMYRRRTVEHRENIDQLRQIYGDDVWPPIPQATVWPETTAYNRTIFTHDPRHAATRLANKLVDRCLERVHTLAGQQAGQQEGQHHG